MSTHSGDTPATNVPRATYRLQLQPEFGFDDAAHVAGYLAELGVSHVYSSPYLQAAPGSTHGYDIVDPRRVNAELGGPVAHQRFSATLGERGLGQVLDVVPNHMAIGGEEWAASTPFQYFTDHHDPELGAAVSKGRREEFASFGSDPASVPDPQAVESFLRWKVNWDELSQPDHARVLEWHRALIALRRRYPELTDGRLDYVGVEFDEDELNCTARSESVPRHVSRAG